MTSVFIDIDQAASEFNKPQLVKPDEEQSPYPKPILPLSKEKLDALRLWLDDHINAYDIQRHIKATEWAKEQEAYEAADQGPLDDPFVGATGVQVPLIAMAVDPIVARLETGLFKSAPMMRFRAVTKQADEFVKPVEEFVEIYQKHKMQLRRETVPRLIDLALHGTAVFKSVYDCTKYKTFGYDADWKVIEQTNTTFKGPRIIGVPCNRLLFDPTVPTLQDSPLVGEYLELSKTQLEIDAESGKISKSELKELFNQLDNPSRDALESAIDISANQSPPANLQHTVKDLYEVWFTYSVDGKTHNYAAIYHKPTQIFLQLRYNWYFHQRKPYVIIPYVQAKGTLYGLGIAAMTLPLQNIATQWQRHALNNAYLANIKMFIAQKDAKIEQRPKIFTGRVFHVENPQSDFLPFALSDTYPSTLNERNNIFGLAEKRTGVSDYLVGRESPIVGSRATATSTLALIQEGTRRVDSVVENIRIGFRELFTMCIDMWIQYGLGEIDDLIFSSDETRDKLNKFINSNSRANVNNFFTLELAASDATNARAAQQQAQLAIIQSMMMYLEKTIQAAQLVVQSAQTVPQLSTFLGDVMESARSMYIDLLGKYDIPDPEKYLPDLEAFLSSLNLSSPPSQTGLGNAQGDYDPASLGGTIESPIQPSIPSSLPTSQGTY